MKRVMKLKKRKVRTLYLKKVVHWTKDWAAHLELSKKY